MSLLQAHYAQVQRAAGYGPVETCLGELSPRYCQHRFVFTDDPSGLTEIAPGSSIVSIGISPTGPPHVGTIGQIRIACDLQEAGFDVQLVLADLVVYFNQGTDMKDLRALVQRYRQFASAMGFDFGSGRLVVQSETLDVLRTAFVLMPDYDPAAIDRSVDPEQTAFQEELAAAYDEVDIADETNGGSEQPVHLLLAADTLHPLRNHGYDHVCLVVGADNVGLTRQIDSMRRQADMDGRVVGLYTRLVEGIDGTPKMSKQIEGSSIHMDMAPERIQDLVRNPTLDAGRPEHSVVSQMLQHAAPCSGRELTDLERACANGSDRWRAAIDEFAEYIGFLAQIWQHSADGLQEDETGPA